MAERVLFTWSGGKDSAVGFYELQKTGGCEITVLLTTVTQDYGRVSMHGVRVELLERQAASMGVSLEKIPIARDATNDEYERRMKETLVRYKSQGIESVAFGDVFLQDVRRHREENLAKVGMNAMFPLWGRDTTVLARTFIDAGFKAVVTCVDSNMLDGSFVGREFDGEFLSELPPGVDPCGENGEFHSFVYEGPIFRKRIPVIRGSIELRDNRFWYCDLIGDMNRQF